MLLALGARGCRFKPCHGDHFIGGYMAQIQEEHKSPMGIKPRWLAEEDRVAELRVVIKAYLESVDPLLLEWINEYNDILKRWEQTGHTGASRMRETQPL